MRKHILSAAAFVACFAGTVGTASAVTSAPAKPHVASAVENIQYWGGRTRGCQAIGVTVTGRAIPGVAGRGFGRDACSEALRECSYELRQRQRFGANPFGRCVVVR